MVRTRSAGASEPLEKLGTPTRRTRKTLTKPNPKAAPAPIPASVEGEVVVPGPSKEPIPTQRGVEKEIHDRIVVEDRDAATSNPPTQSKTIADAESLTAVIEETPSKSTMVAVDVPIIHTPASSKRPREELEGETASSKRRRRQTSPSIDAEAALFPKKQIDDPMDDDLSHSEPVNSYAEQIRRDRMRRAAARRNARLGITPRRARPVKLDGDNPFGIETFTESEKSAMAQQQVGRQESSDPRTDRQEREERSAAPEHETPRRGLFGSLRDFGSAALSRLGSPFGSVTPGVSPAKSNTAPRRRPLRVWDIQYPEIQSTQDEAPDPAAQQGEMAHPERQKRQAFEDNGMDEDRAYGQLHAIRVDANSDNPPSPVQKQTQPAEARPPVSDAVRAAADARRARRQRLQGKSPVKETPAGAPLFGPNSHYAKGTINPQYLEFMTPGVHPAYRKGAGEKRTLDETLPQIPQPPTASSGRLQPYVEEEGDGEDASDEGPSTPVAKRQKVTDDHLPQTPRSALKLPGTVGRSGRSARFNDDPVASVKRMSPIYGHSPAGEYPYSPNNLFNTFEDDRRHQKEEDSTLLSDPSPTTAANTRTNTGFKRHPGDLLTKAINPPGLENIQFEWSDPNDPNWRPSLANPRPGHFRVPDLDEEMEDEDLDSTTDSIQVETPPQPSAPRMSHAELPKPASSASTAPPSASALEAANLERRRAEATKTKPKTSSRLAEVISARSRSPSPPGLEADEGSDDSAKTPSPTLDAGSRPTWSWDAETNEYISSNASHPDFAYNPQNELVPSFCLRTSSGAFDDKIVGPDHMTEAQRQAHYANKYSSAWAEKAYAFDGPQTYEEAGVGSKYIHDLIRMNDARYPEVVMQCDERFASEWNAHQEAIDLATSQGKRLIATFPDRDGIEMLDEEL